MDVNIWHSLIIYAFFTISEILSNAHGRYTDKTIMRAGKMAGPTGRYLDAAYDETICQTTMDDSYRSRHNYEADVIAFCKEYKNDKLFDVIPGRQHASFDGFTRSKSINNPHALKARLIKYSHKIDKTRYVDFL